MRSLKLFLLSCALLIGAKAEEVKNAVPDGSTFTQEKPIVIEPDINDDSIEHKPDSQSDKIRNQLDDRNLASSNRFGLRHFDFPATITRQIDRNNFKSLSRDQHNARKIEIPDGQKPQETDPRKIPETFLRRENPRMEIVNRLFERETEVNSRKRPENYRRDIEAMPQNDESEEAINDSPESEKDIDDSFESDEAIDDSFEREDHYPFRQSQILLDRRGPQNIDSRKIFEHFRGKKHSRDIKIEKTGFDVRDRQGKIKIIEDTQSNNSRNRGTGRDPSKKAERREFTQFHQLKDSLHDIHSEKIRNRRETEESHSRDSSKTRNGNLERGQGVGDSPREKENRLIRSKQPLPLKFEKTRTQNIDSRRMPEHPLREEHSRLPENVDIRQHQRSPNGFENPRRRPEEMRQNDNLEREIKIIPRKLETPRKSEEIRPNDNLERKGQRNLHSERRTNKLETSPINRSEERGFSQFRQEPRTGKQARDGR